MNQERLVTNITNQIKEVQLKIGYAPETIRLYYPPETLGELSGITWQKPKELCARLTKELENSVLGNLEFSVCAERIEVCVPPKGALYVHEKIKNPSFLEALVELFRENHHCSMEDVKKIFSSFSEDYICKEMEKEQDFDYVIYFRDKTIDEFYYCFKSEMGHTIYHRFAKEDYQRLIG